MNNVNIWLFGVRIEHIPEEDGTYGVRCRAHIGIGVEGEVCVLQNIYSPGVYSVDVASVRDPYMIECENEEKQLLTSILKALGLVDELIQPAMKDAQRVLAVDVPQSSRYIRLDGREVEGYQQKWRTQNG